MIKLSMIFREERGIALVATVLILLLLLTLGTVLLSISTTERKIAINQKIATQALYLAEAGVNMAIAELKTNPNLLSGTTPYFLNSTPKYLGSEQGFVKEVKLEKNDDGSINILSIGEINTFARKVSVDVEIINNTSTTRVVAGSVNLKSGTINGDLYILNDTDHYVDNVNGSVWVNGNLNIEGVVTGNVHVTGEMEVVNIARILDWYEKEAQTNNNIVFIKGHADKHDIIDGKTNVVTGNVSLNGKGTYNGTIICGGELDLSNSHFSGIVIADKIVNSNDSGHATITATNNPEMIGNVILPPKLGETVITILNWHDVKY